MADCSVSTAFLPRVPCRGDPQHQRTRRHRSGKEVHNCSGPLPVCGVRKELPYKQGSTISETDSNRGRSVGALEKQQMNRVRSLLTR